MDKLKFSVLMSLYINETARNFQDCIESVINQTLVPDEIVLVLDGPIKDDLKELIEEYILKYPGRINLVKNEKNLGLGLALKKGVEHCKYDLIARMDTDDICRPDRFEKQIKEFIDDSELDICGSHIIEFEGDVHNRITKRMVPITHDAIIEYQKMRSAFNHMTVMYKKNKVMDSGNYEDAPYMEDDMMWMNLILNDAKCKNIDDYLVFVRVGKDMFARRGGKKYFFHYKDARKKYLNAKYINLYEYYLSLLIQIVVSLVPNNLRSIIFKKVLRESL